MQVYRFPLPKMNASYWPLLVGKHPKLHPFFEDFWIFIIEKHRKNPSNHPVTWNRLTFLLPRLSRHEHSICFEVDALLAISGPSQNHPYRLERWGVEEVYACKTCIESYRILLMITSLRLFQRYIYPRRYQHLLRLSQYILAQQVTMKQVYHTIPSDMPWTVSSGTRDFRSCCEKKMQWSHSCSTWWREDAPVAPVDRLVCWNSFFHPVGDTTRFLSHNINSSLSASNNGADEVENLDRKSSSKPSTCGYEIPVHLNTGVKKQRDLTIYIYIYIICKRIAYAMYANNCEHTANDLKHLHNCTTLNFSIANFNLSWKALSHVDHQIIGATVFNRSSHPNIVIGIAGMQIPANHSKWVSQNGDPEIVKKRCRT